MYLTSDILFFIMPPKPHVATLTEEVVDDTNGDDEEGLI
jgi:hypothetical protein